MITVYSLLISVYSLLIILYSLLIIVYSLLIIYYSLLILVDILYLLVYIFSHLIHGNRGLGVEDRNAFQSTNHIQFKCNSLNTGTVRTAPIHS